MDKQAVTNWFDPAFARFGEPLARQMTNWLFGSKSTNPVSYDNPEAWPCSGVGVQVVRKVLTFSSLANGTSSTIQFNIAGGKNAVAFSKFATVRLTEVGDTVGLPNSLADYVLVNISRGDNLVEVPTCPLPHEFGTAAGWPDVPPSPELWLGNLEKTIVVTNNTGETVDVYLSWCTAILNSGQ